MPITLVGTTGITTPGLTNSGNETITGTLNVGGLTPNVYPIVAGTAVASTSGTSIDFTSIPSWVKRITVMLNGVSTNGTSNLQVQIGAGSVTTTGYLSGASLGTTFVSSTTGLLFTASIGAANAANGSIILTLLGNNTWTTMSVVGLTGATGAQTGGGVSPTLGGTLDRVRITTVNGTDTFDAGSINLLWE
jgi:hypothetical protein